MCLIMKPSRQDETTEDDPLAADHRFYYLRLMAKPGRRREPIKAKFIQWSPPVTSLASVDIDLESQAMRVVRTIGQAFEVCHKVAQEQIQEKFQEEAECTRRSKGSIISDGSDAHLNATEEKLSKVVEVSRSTSPTLDSGVRRAQLLASQTRSIFQVQQASEISAQGPFLASVNNPQDLSKKTGLSNEFLSRSTVYAPTSNASGHISQTTSNPHFNTIPSTSNVQQGVNTLNPWPDLVSAENALDQNGIKASIPIYQMPVINPINCMPYGLSSPIMLSPYGTMHLSRESASIPPNVAPEGMDAAAIQLSMSLDQYNQHLIRSQLNQAQQTAQVANCQVQLLRDQLTSETTARIEAQSRTHQLLNANRELLDQVQSLVLRLQNLECGIGLDADSKIEGHQNVERIGAQSVSTTDSIKSVSQLFSRAFAQEDKFKDANLPGPLPIDPSRPYQAQTLADIRAGSLPPHPNYGYLASTIERNKRPVDDSGVKTEPESGADDTTDYSSSDQYEKMPTMLRRHALETSHLNVFSSNPQAMPNLPSHFSGHFLPCIPSVSHEGSRSITNSFEMEQPTGSMQHLSLEKSRTLKNHKDESEYQERQKQVKSFRAFTDRDFNRMYFNARVGSDQNKSVPTDISTPPIVSGSKVDSSDTKAAIGMKDSLYEQFPSNVNDRRRLYSDATHLLNERRNLMSRQSNRERLFDSMKPLQNIQLPLASSSLATAMFPPVHKRSLVKAMSGDLNLGKAIGNGPILQRDISDLIEGRNAVSEGIRPKITVSSIDSTLGKNEMQGSSNSIPVDRVTNQKNTTTIL